MMPIAPAVFDCGRPSASSLTTYCASFDLSSPLLSTTRPVQQETGVICSRTIPTDDAVPAVRKHPSFFASFATTPRCHNHCDPLDEELHLRPCNKYFSFPITFANPYLFSRHISDTTAAVPFVNPVPPPDQPSTTTRLLSTTPHRLFLQR
jgi:hypothetical protein